MEESWDQAGSERTQGVILHLLVWTGSWQSLTIINVTQYSDFDRFFWRDLEDEGKSWNLEHDSG
jgi:hypothetical protein